MTRYDLPNPFMLVSAKDLLGSLPSGESDPVVMQDWALADGEAAALEPDEPPFRGAAAAEPVGYRCCVDCGDREPCDEHCPWSGKPIPTSPDPTAHFQIDEAAFMAEIDPPPLFLTRDNGIAMEFHVADNRASEIEELLQLARAEEWPAPPRRMTA